MPEYSLKADVSQTRLTTAVPPQQSPCCRGAGFKARVPSSTGSMMGGIALAASTAASTACNPGPVGSCCWRSESPRPSVREHRGFLCWDTANRTLSLEPLSVASLCPRSESLSPYPVGWDKKAVSDGAVCCHQQTFLEHLLYIQSIAMSRSGLPALCLTPPQSSRNGHGVWKFLC